LKGNSRISSYSLDSARPTQFMLVLQRLKKEHMALKEKVTDLYTKAEQVHRNQDVPFAR
jgi:hypothetical protein